MKTGLQASLRLALAAAALGVCVAGSAAEPEMLARIGAQIGQHAVVRAEFTQTRQMAVMKRPLVTSGRLVYARQQGVLWQIDQPYRMTYALGEERMAEIGADGARRERRLRDVPGLAQVSRVLRALFGADTAVLQEHFEITLRGDTAKWELELKPRQAQLAQVITALQVSGGRFVEAIRMEEAGGDTTQIRFRNPQAAAAPDAAELQLFGPPKP
jgi:hypothetical protein